LNQDLKSDAEIKESCNMLKRLNQKKMRIKNTTQTFDKMELKNFSTQN